MGLEVPISLPVVRLVSRVLRGQVGAAELLGYYPPELITTAGGWANRGTAGAEMDLLVQGTPAGLTRIVDGTTGFNLSNAVDATAHLQSRVVVPLQGALTVLMFVVIGGSTPSEWKLFDQFDAATTNRYIMGRAGADFELQRAFGSTAASMLLPVGRQVVAATFKTNRRLDFYSTLGDDIRNHNEAGSPVPVWDYGRFFADSSDGRRASDVSLGEIFIYEGGLVGQEYDNAIAELETKWQV